MAVKLKIFVSHSMSEDDKHILDQLERRIGPGVKLYVAEWNPTPGQPLKKKIEKAVTKSDFVLAILSKDGARSTWVNQEIGLAIGKGKTIIPLREKGVEVKGLVHDLEWITFDREDPEDALRVTTTYLRKLQSDKADRVAHREGFGWGILVLTIVGAIALILLALALSDSE